VTARRATLILVDEQGEPLPPGTRVTLLASGETTLVGFDGQVFFPMLEAVNRILADTAPVPCEVEVRFEPEQAMRTIGPFVCGPP
jgi:outer membrane usher protein